MTKTTFTAADFLFAACLNHGSTAAGAKQAASYDGIEVSIYTARKYLNKAVEGGLLVKAKTGRAYRYTVSEEARRVFNANTVEAFQAAARRFLNGGCDDAVKKAAAAAIAGNIADTVAENGGKRPAAWKTLDDAIEAHGVDTSFDVVDFDYPGTTHDGIVAAWSDIAAAALEMSVDVWPGDASDDMTIANEVVTPVAVEAFGSDKSPTGLQTVAVRITFVAADGRKGAALYLRSDVEFSVYSDVADSPVSRDDFFGRYGCVGFDDAGASLTYTGARFVLVCVDWFDLFADLVDVADPDADFNAANPDTLDDSEGADADFNATTDRAVEIGDACYHVADGPSVLLRVEKDVSMGAVRVVAIGNAKAGDFLFWRSDLRFAMETAKTRIAEESPILVPAEAATVESASIEQIVERIVVAVSALYAKASKDFFDGVAFEAVAAAIGWKLDADVFFLDDFSVAMMTATGTGRILSVKGIAVVKPVADTSNDSDAAEEGIRGLKSDNVDSRRYRNGDAFFADFADNGIALVILKDATESTVSFDIYKTPETIGFDHVRIGEAFAPGERLRHNGAIAHGEDPSVRGYLKSHGATEVIALNSRSASGRFARLETVASLASIWKLTVAFPNGNQATKSFRGFADAYRSFFDALDRVEDLRGFDGFAFYCGVDILDIEEVVERIVEPDAATMPLYRVEHADGDYAVGIQGEDTKFTVYAGPFADRDYPVDDSTVVTFTLKDAIRKARAAIGCAEGPIDPVESDYYMSFCRDCRVPHFETDALTAGEVDFECENPNEITGDVDFQECDICRRAVRSVSAVARKIRPSLFVCSCCLQRTKLNRDYPVDACAFCGDEVERGTLLLFPDGVGGCRRCFMSINPENMNYPARPSKDYTIGIRATKLSSASAGRLKFSVRESHTEGGEPLFESTDLYDVRDFVFRALDTVKAEIRVDAAPNLRAEGSVEYSARDYWRHEAPFMFETWIKTGGEYQIVSVGIGGDFTFERRVGVSIDSVDTDNAFAGI